MKREIETETRDGEVKRQEVDLNEVRREFATLFPELCISLINERR
jgi:hypothetical protein